MTIVIYVVVGKGKDSKWLKQFGLNEILLKFVIFSNLICFLTRLCQLMAHFVNCV